MSPLLCSVVSWVAEVQLVPCGLPCTQSLVYLEVVRAEYSIVSLLYYVDQISNLMCASTSS